MGYKYVVFGAGRQGTAAIHDLLVNCEADAVLAVDPDGRALARASSRLESLLGPVSQRLATATTASADDVAACDVVVSCAPYRFNLQLTESALRAEVPFCDLGGNPHTVARQQRAVADGHFRTPVVPDCGVSPGLSNILAVHLARAHGADCIHVRCGSVPITEDAAAGPLKYWLLFDPQGLISEYSGKVPVIRDGEMQFIDALSCIEPFGAGRYEASPTSNNSPPVVEFLHSLGVCE